jgi:hypothetical protein
LKREQTSTSPRAGSSTTIATRFLAGADVLPLNLDRIPPNGSVEDQGIFDEAMLARPVHGPDFAFVRADGTPLTAPSLTGQPVILSFSSPGCIPCGPDLAAFDNAAKVLKETWGQAFRIVESNSAESNSAAATPESGSANFQNASAPADQVTRQGIQMLPALMVMTPRGSIYRTIQGHVSQEYILKLVEEAKAQKGTVAGEAGRCSDGSG